MHAHLGNTTEQAGNLYIGASEKRLDFKLASRLPDNPDFILWLKRDILQKWVGLSKGLFSVANGDRPIFHSPYAVCSNALWKFRLNRDCKRMYAEDFKNRLWSL